MATTAQVFANRENSKLSTGPRTPEGKAASSPNAKTHGLGAADPVLPHEDRNQFNSLLEQYKSDFEPVTAHEEFLVSQMAGARWKLDRAERIETAMFAALESPDDRRPPKRTRLTLFGQEPPASRGPPPGQAWVAPSRLTDA